MAVGQDANRQYGSSTIYLAGTPGGKWMAMALLQKQTNGLSLVCSTTYHAYPFSLLMLDD